jgi:hypothetical protein
VCECTVGVDVGDGTTIHLVLILSNVAMGCIVLGRQMNVYRYFGIIKIPHTLLEASVQNQEGVWSWFWFRTDFFG